MTNMPILRRTVHVSKWEVYTDFKFFTKSASFSIKPVFSVLPCFCKASPTSFKCVWPSTSVFENMFLTFFAASASLASSSTGGASAAAFGFFFPFFYPPPSYWSSSSWSSTSNVFFGASNVFLGACLVGLCLNLVSRKSISAVSSFSLSTSANESTN